MKVERKQYETVITMEPWDWAGGKAKKVMQKIKDGGGVYYGTDKSWHMRDINAAEHIFDSMVIPDQVCLHGTEHYADEFLDQFKELP